MSVYQENRNEKIKDQAYDRYQSERTAHWNTMARKMRTWKSWGGYYHKRLLETYRFMVTPGQRILEIGCGNGDLLTALRPSQGVGLDFSSEMIQLAREKHPELEFIEVDAHEFNLDGKFDIIILSDTINDLWDVQQVLKKLKTLSHPSTRVLLNYYSRLWELPLKLARGLGLATPTLYQNWLTPEDVNNLLYLEGFEEIRKWEEVLFPLNIPLLTPLCNRYLVRFWPFRHLALTNFSMSRPFPESNWKPEPKVSVIVPARNEEGNIQNIFDRVPQMGSGTELVFVEGNSSDNTYAAIEQAIQDNPQAEAVLFRQDGKGKGDAVRKGFQHATGDILMILDADLTVPPEDLPLFYEALITGKGDMINGVRLVYPMEKEAMRFFNLLGNKFFSMVFSWLLGQPIKDTLCGTKVMSKENYEKIAANRSYFGEFDPFGDFDLIFGAAHLNFRIVDIPIRYRERTYGSTNIDRWRHGWLLLRMVAFAARRIKFI